MLIFIENTPRAYAWGSRDALPSLLGTAPTGEPQAELWLGDHPGAPASVAKARPAPQTLIELIESDPERYGVDGAHLPFLLKVLGIGAPLSLQVHPDRLQALEGFAQEEAMGVPLGARERNYGDPNHKPELLVALAEVTALCGFRPLQEAKADLLALAIAAPSGPARTALERAVELCEGSGEDEARDARAALLAWALAGDDSAGLAAGGIALALDRGAEVGEDRLRSLRELTAAHPKDPGVLLSLLLHLVRLRPGEAVSLGPRQLHAYLSGIAVEVMAASDNVLRAGLTAKHIDAVEVMRIVDTGTLDSPRVEPRILAPGLIAWQPDVPDFMLMRARLGEASEEAAHDGAAPHEEPQWQRCAEEVRVDAPYPMVLVVVEGRARVARAGAELAELASVRRGQSLYVSAGEAIELSGVAEVFIATVGAGWFRVS